MSKDIWHTADIRPEPFKTFVFKTDKGNICSNMLSANSDWNPILLPEFYSMDDFDKAERIIKWCYLDDLLALETELERTRKALEIAVDKLKEIDKTRSVANHKIGTQDKTLNPGNVFCWTTPDEIHNALVEITALEQKD